MKATSKSGIGGECGAGEEEGGRGGEVSCDPVKKHTTKAEEGRRGRRRRRDLTVFQDIHSSNCAVQERGERYIFKTHRSSESRGGPGNSFLFRQNESCIGALLSWLLFALLLLFLLLPPFPGRNVATTETDVYHHNGAFSRPTCLRRIARLEQAGSGFRLFLGNGNKQWNSPVYGSKGAKRWGRKLSFPHDFALARRARFGILDSRHLYISTALFASGKWEIYLLSSCFSS